MSVWVLDSLSALARVPLFLAALLQATSLPFIVTASQLGLLLGEFSATTAAGLIAAGLLLSSRLLWQALRRRSGGEVIMRFGLYLPTEGDFADVRLLARLAHEAEDAGWDGFFIWDELLPIYEHSDSVRNALGQSGNVVDAFVALTAIAATTGRLRFGALVTPLSRLRPEVFAKQTATLDRYSEGRLTLGIGLGNPDTQFTAFGGEADVRVRAAMVDEFLDLLAQLWSGQEVNTRGVHYVATGVSMVPTPVQTPRIPIWIGADSKNRAPRRRAARWDGFVPASDSWPDGVISVAEYEAIVADITALRPRLHPFDVVLIGNASGTLPATDSLPAYAAAGVTWVLAQALSVAEAQNRIRKGPPTLPA